MRDKCHFSDDQAGGLQKDSSRMINMKNDEEGTKTHVSGYD